MLGLAALAGAGVALALSGGPRASEPPTDAPEPTLQAWQPLSDDEATGEALLSSLKKPGDPENATDGKPGGGRPGLN